jgi:antirestriction protein ArdC
MTTTSTAANSAATANAVAVGQNTGRTPIVRHKSGRPDVYQTVTDRIVAALEAGTVPWIRPWDIEGAPGTQRDYGFPRNGHTGRPYAGINVLLLWLTATERGYASNEWFTMHQANTLGARVRKGEHGTLITFWRTIKPSTTAQDDAEANGTTEDEPADHEVPFLKCYTVFNREQLDGLPRTQESTQEEGREQSAREGLDDATPVAASLNERLDAVEEFVRRTSAVVTESATTRVPCYRVDTDRVHMPPLRVFHTREDFYASLLHELTHWTGHTSRLARAMTGGFGTAEYAREELTAEIGSAFLSADFALAGNLQHPEYVGHWIQVLRDDNRAVFRAAREARQAVAYLYDLTATGTDTNHADTSAHHATSQSVEGAR